MYTQAKYLSISWERKSRHKADIQQQSSGTASEISNPFAFISLSGRAKREDGGKREEGEIARLAKGGRERA